MGGLLSIVQTLEGKTNNQRCNAVTRLLADRGIKADEQRFGFFYEHGLDKFGLDNLGIGAHKNHIISTGFGTEEVIVSGHYDRVRTSPGANDNASSVAVLFGVMDAMRGKQLPYRLTYIVFAEEEAGLVGSAKYILARGVDKTCAVINMEWVGSGETVLTWPIRDQSAEFIYALHRSINNSGGHPLHFGDFPHEGLIGDHTSFLDAGVRDSICLTLAEKADLEVLEEFLSAQASGDFSNDELLRICLQAPAFKRYHQPEDKSRYLSEDSLQLCVDSIVGTLTKMAENKSAGKKFP